jgi:methoxymalonate biosynthesis acyl carrier protein
MPTNNRVESDLLTFLRDHRQGDASIDVETDLFDAGMLDSLMLVDLILRIEKVHGVTLGDQDVTRTNFCTIAQLARVVAARTASESRRAA